MQVSANRYFSVNAPMTGAWDVGTRIAGAAALAVDKINANETLLPGRDLRLRWADSGCSEKQGLAAMGKLLASESRIDAVIGPGCSSACKVTGHLSEAQKIPQISWGCTSSSLSNKEDYNLVCLGSHACLGLGVVLISLEESRFINVF